MHNKSSFLGEKNSSFRKKATSRFLRSSALIICALSFFCLGTPLARAVYVKDYPVTVEQPDGTKLSLLVTGDEYFRYTHTPNGSIVEPDKKGTVRFALLDGKGKITAGTRKVTNDNKKTYSGLKARNVDVSKNVDVSALKKNATRTQLPQASTNLDQRLSAPATAYASSITKNDLSNVVIYIRFSDEAEFVTADLAAQDKGLFNTNVRSLKTFIEAQSEGDCSVNSVFAQNSSGTVVSYQDAHPRGYYQPYSESGNPLGYADEDEGYTRENELLDAALKWADSLPSMPSAEKLDTNSDGAIDALTFIISGTSNGWGDSLWPHMTSFNEGDIDATINGVSPYTYTFQLSNFYGSGTNRARLLSVYAHETMHMLGFPDLYRYYEEGDPVGAWDVMSNNMQVPQNANSFMRWAVADWGDEPKEITAYGTYSVKRPGSSNSAPSVWYYDLGNDEYLIIEYRKKIAGSWDEQIAGSGLLMYRVRGTRALYGRGNSFSGGQYEDTYYIYRPGEKTTTYTYSNGTRVTYPWYRAAVGSLAQATLSSSVGRTQYGSATVPSSSLFSSTGQINNVVVSGVGQTTGDTIQFTLEVHHSVVLHPQNGNAPAVYSARLGLPIATPADPSRSGYKFQGWFTAPTGGTRFNFSQAITQNTVLYAQWKSTSGYVTSISKSTGTWNRAWSKTNYYPKSRTITLKRSKSSVKIRPSYSAGSRLYVRYAGGSWSRLTGSKTVKVKRGKSKTLYFRCVAEAGNRRTYKLVIKRRR